MKVSIEKISIGQGFRGKTGKIGCGDCMGGFDSCVNGCRADAS